MISLNHLPRTALCALAAVTLVLSACGSDEDKDIEGMTGERISVLSFERGLKADPQIARIQVRLPVPYKNEEWPQAGGHPDHAMHHLKVDETLSKAWSANAGKGERSTAQLISAPVVAEGKVYVLDTNTELYAFNEESGKRLWRRDLRPRDKSSGKDFFGGGIAYSDGTLFVTTGFGWVWALDADNGSEVWRFNLGRPLRAAPTVVEGRVFVVTYDNQLHALDVTDGDQLWSQEGIVESAGLLGSASPAVANGLVIAPYSSGELYALRVENGRVAWSDALSRTGRLTPLAVLSDIDGHPVVDGDRVYAVSHGGRMAAIDLRTGERVWERNIAGSQSPWLAGDFLFLVTLDADVVCLSRADGRIRWVRRLARWEDEEDREDPITWSGPVLVSDRLILVSSQGQAVSVSPYTGEVLGQLKLPGAALLPPVVANGSLYFLTNDSKLVAMR